MKLAEMKAKVYQLIEEYSEDSDDLTEDEDLASKMNTVINQVLTEMSRFKKIDAYKELDVQEGEIIDFQDIDKQLYQINIIRGLDFDIIGNKVIFNEKGTAKIFYYKYPTQIDEDTDDDEYEFEVSTDVLEIMPYGIASDLLKSDVSSNYGQIYAQRFQEMKQQLDSRNAMTSIYIDGGVSI